MRFSEIVADSAFVGELVSMADKGMLGHALLLHENEGGGGLALAVGLAQYLFCNNRKGGDSCGICPSCRKTASLIHPDLHFAYPVNTGNLLGPDRKPTSEAYLRYWRELFNENPYFGEQQLYEKLGIDTKSGVISVAESKRIIERLNLTALESDIRIMIVWLPERMNTEAANKLLKILEEPYPGTLFILVTHAPEKMIPTVVSRCRLLRVPPADEMQIAESLSESYHADMDRAREAAALSGGSYGLACRFLNGDTASGELTEIVHLLVSAAINKNLLEVMAAGERISQLSSRERMKSFCIKAAVFVRMVYLYQLGMEQLANIPVSEASFVRDVARRSSRDFCQRIMEHIDRAYMLTDRNVSAKILFCDLANRFYAYI